MQTNRDAVDALIHGRRAEYVPLQDQPWADTLKPWHGEGMPEGDVGEHFGFAMSSCGGWWEVSARPGVNEVVEETLEWRAARNGSGAVLKYWKSKSGTPEHMDFDMNSREIWEAKYRPYVVAGCSAARKSWSH